MKTTLRTAATAAAAVLASAAPAFAAPEYTDHSGLLVWTFLGFCALIVVAQVMPAVMLIIGAARGFRSQPGFSEPGKSLQHLTGGCRHRL